MSEVGGALAVSVVLLVALAAMTGFVLAQASLAEERSEIEQLRELLDVETAALERRRRLQEVFLAAQRAMRREAIRQHHCHLDVESTEVDP